MTVDRDQALVLLWKAVDDLRGGPEALQYILTELEQAERERDEARKQVLLFEDIAGDERDRAADAEARLSRVPALVEALRTMCELIEDGTFGTQGRIYQSAKGGRDALTAWEQE